MEIKIQIEGLEEVQDFLETDVPDSIEQGVTDALEEAADDMYGECTLLCPVDTGALRDSIVIEVQGDEIVAEVGMDYASYVDEGTYKMDAQPFFNDPINDYITAVLPALVESKIKEALGT